MVIWMIGLSGAGKTTLAYSLHSFLQEKGVKSLVLDGDDLRKHLNKDLGYGRADRRESVRRAAEAARLFARLDMLPIVALITPFEDDRVLAREILKEHTPYFIYLKCSIEECEKRDPKGLYKKVRFGSIQEFTGVSAPFESPVSVELTLDTHILSKEEVLSDIIAAMGL